MKIIFVDPQNDPRLFTDFIKPYEMKDEKAPFNFYSIYDYGRRLDRLIPNDGLYDMLRARDFGDAEGDQLSHEFDKAYYQYLMMYNPAFIDFMKLVCTLDDDKDTIVMSNHSNRLVTPIVDSLIKALSVRYGVVSGIVNTIDDIGDITKIPEATVEDLYLKTYVSDIARYVKLTGIPPIKPVPKEKIEEDLESLSYSDSEV